MTIEEKKVCQNCQQEFTIEPEDFDFYKRIDVPPPTWCPQCRMSRLMMFNLDSTTLYRIKCAAPGHGEMIYSNYPEDSPMPIYDHEYWRSDAWDPRDYGREYDFSRNFFEQFKELADAVPLRNLELTNSPSCDYCPSATDSKNCYFSSGMFGSENCLYSHTALMSRECVDVCLVLFDEQVYNSFSVDKSFQSTNSAVSEELVNCDFMYDCRNCSDCLGCVNLRSRRYCIFNKQYSKEEYKKERAKYDLGSYAGREKVREQFAKLMLEMPKKYTFIQNAPDCTGDNIMNAKNSKHIFQAVDDIENCKYCLVLGRGTKDSYDIAGAGLKSMLLYQAAATVNSERVFFSRRIHNCHDIYYSRECYDSSDLFGCVGLRSKQYCILNKQYTKEVYEDLVAKIKAQMRKMTYTSPRGQVYGFGEFFPIEHSPVAFNASWRHEYFPLSKEEAIAQGFKWKDREISHEATIAAADLPDHIKDADDNILKEAVGCAHKAQCKHNCTKVFRIIPGELEFYRKFNIALPRLCPTCRLGEQYDAYIRPYQLWERQCMCQSQEATQKGRYYKNTVAHFHGADPCPSKFQTAFAPERPDLLYCEECYNSEIL